MDMIWSSIDIFVRMFRRHRMGIFDTADFVFRKKSHLRNPISSI